MHADHSTYLTTMTVAMFSSALIVIAYAIIPPPQEGNLRRLHLIGLSGLLALVLLVWIDPNNVIHIGVTTLHGVLVTAALVFPFFTIGTISALVAVSRKSRPQGWLTATALVLMLLNIPWMYLMTI